MIRETVWAGAQKFYPDDREALLKYFSRVMDKDAEKIQAKVVMVPHAGYYFSGAVAAKTFSSVKIPENVIILGPNHTGLGRPYSVMSKGRWATPLGPVNINQ
jgi:AmmeMemoRadiSam system protein B